MTPATAFLAFIVVQRLSELVLARANTARLLARGAVEVGARHYPVMVAMHAGWLAALVVFGWQNPVSWPWRRSRGCRGCAAGSCSRWVGAGRRGSSWMTRRWSLRARSG